MSLTPDESAAFESDRHDKELMRLIAVDDGTALRELVEKHQGAVYGTIVKMLGDPFEAQDLAQQVFVRVYRSAASYRATAQFRTWMFTILRNLVFNEHRRRSRASLVAIPAPDEEMATAKEIADLRIKTPGEEVLRKEMFREIDQAILNLPEQQRLAVVLRRYDELPYEEIAEVLKTTVASVKSLLFRARESLRKSLESYLEADEKKKK